MTTDIIDIHNEATQAAKAACLAYLNDKLGGKDNYPCGFAWVVLENVKMNTKVGKEFAKIGFSRSSGMGVYLWNPGRYMGQNVDATEAGATAYAKVFEKYGFTMYSMSRLD